MSEQAAGPAAKCYDQAQNFLQARQVRAALSAADEAERLGFDPNDCAALRWDCWMLVGEFDRAWAESAAIAKRARFDPHRFWDGEPLSGKHIMLRCLHGLGDTIQFIRFAPLIRQNAASLTVQTHPQLVRLLQHAKGVDSVLTWGDGKLEPDWDAQIEITELPRIFGTTLDTVPNQVPYFDLNPQPGSHPPRIGLAWAASEWNPARSVSREQLFEALESADAELIPMQFDPAAPVDILDAAKAMLTCDLIVSVDTMTAHLAGALALPAAVLLPFSADWRWMLDRDDSPWYPTMRLFRQAAPGDWESALQRLRDSEIVKGLGRA